MSISSVIQKKPGLVWYVADPSQLSEESIVEHVLQYGDWEDVKSLFKEKSITEIGALFKKTLKKKRSNYSPAIKHFFKLYFSRHAP